MFDTVLVANRGEIAVRVMRTLRALGIRAAAVYSDADAGARHVRDADVAVRLGPAPARESYLHVERVLDAATSVGADALHPGYGFLAENEALAAGCAARGIVFIGPPAEAIRTMGDKIRARHAVESAGVRVVPGGGEAGMTDDELVAIVHDVGFPVLLKPSAGGGGKGMRVVDDDAGLRDAIVSARREARGAFGDDTLLVERFVQRPRHIEIQIAADAHGQVVHLGERECSLQRRHQKIVEEAPSPFVTPDVRAAMGAQAVAAARACGYVNVGTVELIVSGDDSSDFFFMEMNTRLQVEHPVTELAYGVDLVDAQLRIAAGEPLPWTQDDLVPRRHAIEARIYAEDPARGFLPTGGTVHLLREPDDVRVDSGLLAGSVVGSDYDPMLSKVIAAGVDRRAALRALDDALGRTAVLGVTTNIAFLRALLRDDAVVAGELDTGLVERRLDALVDDVVPAEVDVVARIAAARPADPGDPWSALVDWRHGGGSSPAHEWLAADQVRVAGGTYDVVVVDGTAWIGRGGASWAVPVGVDTAADARAGADGIHGPVRSPMPGVVIEIKVGAGDSVTRGQPVAVVEAMKMEHTLTAPVAGIVSEVHAAVGTQVALDEAVVTIEPEAEHVGAE